MSHSNISIFVPHAGCPHLCSFCDQRTITGKTASPHAEDVKRICMQALNEVSDPSDTEIAFFGGSFTAIPREYMLELLGAAKPFLGSGGFKGIRISTRPDCIDDETLRLLGEYGVSAIELGAQSMSDKVLSANMRGHTAADVFKASELIRQHGFELGLQIMVGLYRSDIADERMTADAVRDIAPDTVRIYPVCVLDGTRLAELYQSGEYRLMSFDEELGLCAEFAASFDRAGIKLLRIGLHASESVERGVVAGYYHPAFGELVRSRIIRDIIEDNMPAGCEMLTVYCGRKLISAAGGHKKSNKSYFSEKGVRLDIKPDSTLGDREIKIGRDVFTCI